MERLTIKAPSGLIHLEDNKGSTVNKAIKKLSDYEDLEEQGLLLKLPCKVGDKTYFISYGEIFALVVDSFVIYADGTDARSVDGEGKNKFLKVDLDISGFGKTWFATQKEVEEALRNEWDVG